MTTAKAAFGKGDRVAWSHEYAGQFPPDIAVYADAAVAAGARLGTVKKTTNDEGTYFAVELDAAKKGGKTETRELTVDELVAVRERD